MKVDIAPSLFSLCKDLREDMMDGKIGELKEKINQLEKQLEDKTFSIEEKFYVLSTLGKYYRKVKNYDRSGDYSRGAIRLTKQLDKKHIEMMIDTYLDYAHLELEYGQESNARIELAKLLALLDTHQYRDSYTLGVIFSSLARISLKEENFESGIKQYEKALIYYRQILSDTHPLLSDTIYQLSNVYIQLEDYHQALHLHEALLAAFQAEEDDLSTARELLKIGEIYFYIDLKEARKIITKAIKVLTTLQDDKYSDMSKATLMLAEIDENMGNFPRAINYYKQALEQLTNLYEEHHFMMVYVYSKIGTISIRTFKLKQAKEYLEKGLKLSKAYPKIRMQFLYALGKIYSDEEEYSQALILFQEFLERLEKEGRRNSLGYANTLQAIAFNYIKQNNLEVAFVQYKEALEIYEKLPNCKEEKGLTYIRLAYCYENRVEQDIQNAEKCYVKGFELIERTLNEELLEEALAGIIDFYTRNDNATKRRLYENKLVKHIKALE